MSMEEHDVFDDVFEEIGLAEDDDQVHAIHDLLFCGLSVWATYSVSQGLVMSIRARRNKELSLHVKYIV